MKKIWTFIFAVSFSFSGTAAAAQWLEVKSDKFVFQGDLPASKAQKLVADLEAYHMLVMDALGGKPTAQASKIEIFAVKAAPELEGALLYENYSVLSQDNLDGPTFLIHRNAINIDLGESSYPMLREIALHVIRVSAPDQYPYWMQSGLADIWAGSQLANLKANGAPPHAAYEYLLSQSKWIPMKRIISGLTERDARVIFNENADEHSDAESAFRAQSWAATNYIRQRPDMAARMPAYLDGLDSGIEPRKAFKRAFGMSVRRFEKRLKTAVRTQFETKPNSPENDNFLAVEPLIRPLDTSASAAAYAKILNTFALNEEGQNLANRYYSDAARLTGSRALGFAGQAEVAVQQGDFEGGQSFFEKAVALTQTDPDIRKRAGFFYLSRYEKTGKVDWLLPARDHFQAALKGIENDPVTSLSYATICAQIECTGGSDVEAAVSALSFFRDAAYIDLNFAVLPLLDENGEFDQIIKFAEFARVWGESTETRLQAETILQAVKRKKAKVVN